jgi:hypothetical protein
MKEKYSQSKLDCYMQFDGQRNQQVGCACKIHPVTKVGRHVNMYIFNYCEEMVDIEILKKCVP